MCINSSPMPPKPCLYRSGMALPLDREVVAFFEKLADNLEWQRHYVEACIQNSKSISPGEAALLYPKSMSNAVMKGSALSS